MKTILRWIAVVPAYIMGHILSILMIRFTYRVLSDFEPSTEMPFYGIESGNSMRSILWSVMAHALGVYSGLDWATKIAPYHKRKTAIILSIIPVTIIAISQTLSIINGYNAMVFVYGASLLAGLFVYWVKKNKELNDGKKD